MLILPSLTRKCLFGTFLFATCVLGSPTSALAVPISVANYSFETLPSGGLPFHFCIGGCASWSIDSIPGWTNSGTSGQGIIGGYSGNPNAIDGSVLGYTADNPISQDVATAVAGVTYTLDVALLHRTDFPMLGMIQLEIGGVVVATATGVDGGPGTWNDWTAVYTATAADIGKTVTILLSTTGQQGDFDNVRLDATSIPEPGTFLLLAIGLIGFHGYGCRKAAIFSYD